MRRENRALKMEKEIVPVLGRCSCGSPSGFHLVPFARFRPGSSVSVKQQASSPRRSPRQAGGDQGVDVALETTKALIALLLAPRPSPGRTTTWQSEGR